MFVAFLNSQRLISLCPRTVVCVQNQSMLTTGDSDVAGDLEQPQINHFMASYIVLCTDTSTEISIRYV